MQTNMQKIMLQRLALEDRMLRQEARGPRDLTYEDALQRCWGCFKKLDIFEVKAQCLCRGCQGKRQWERN